MWCRRCLFPLGSPDGVSLVEWVEHNQLRGRERNMLIRCRGGSGYSEVCIYIRMQSGLVLGYRLYNWIACSLHKVYITCLK